MIDKKIILVIGGCGLLGKAIATSIIKDNGIPVIADMDAYAFEKIFNQFEFSLPEFIQMDVTKENDIQKALDELDKKFQRIDGVVNSSYPRNEAWGVDFHNINYKDISENISMQLGSAIILSKLVTSYFERQGYGTLLHISSIQGVNAPKFEHYIDTQMTSPIEYTAVKSGIISITKYIAKLSKNKNIRVNCVSPGGIKDNQPEVFVERYKNSCINKGMLDPEDICGTVLFLLSEHSAYINGQNIIVDDGWVL